MRPHLLGAALLCTLASSARPASTLDEPEDWVVSRSGPDGKSSFSEPSRLGILLTSYQRSPLYEAYRAMVLGKTFVDAEDRKHELHRRGEDDPIEAWRAARGSVTSAPPRRALAMERSIAAEAFGGFVNCTPGAFRLAVETLAALRERKGTKVDDVRAWVAAQDAVFEFCAFVPGAPAEKGEESVPSPEVPSPLPKKANPHLRQLRDYQIAAALFYAGRQAEARAKFEAIGKTARHPMQSWAALAALRTRLREASLDLSLAYEARQLWRKVKNPEEGRAKVAELVAQDRRRKVTALAEIEADAQRLLSRKDLTAIHDATRALVLQATKMLDPRRSFSARTDRLADLRQNPFKEGDLFEWQLLSDQVLDVAPGADPTLTELIVALRRKHAFFDWIRTIQGCTDNRASPNAAGQCDAEHAHARALWAEHQDPVWLVAALMTAQTPTVDDEPVLKAALEVKPDALEWLTLRYHAAQLLQRSGRRAQARSIVDEALQRPDLRGSDQHLLQQARLSVCESISEIGPYLLRHRSWRGAPTERVALGADSDALLNRILGSEDLLALAKMPNVPAPLRSQLYVAAWMRADLAGNPGVAEKAARLVQTQVPTLASVMERYLRASDPAERRWVRTLAGLTWDVSPVVGWDRDSRHAFATPRDERSSPRSWCSFDPARFELEQKIQRMPPPPALALQAGADQEQAALRAMGPWSSDLAERVFAVARTGKLKAQARQSLLKLVELAAAEEACPNPNGARLAAEARALAEER